MVGYITTFLKHKLLVNWWFLGTELVVHIVLKFWIGFEDFGALQNNYPAKELVQCWQGWEVNAKLTLGVENNS